MNKDNTGALSTSHHNAATSGIWLHEYEPLVKSIAKQLMTRLPASVQFEDLVQAGMIGLLESKEKYSEEKGASFQTYASIRIRGAMLDEVRREDWAPRSVHKNARDIAAAMKILENQYGRKVSAQEVAQYLEISLNAYHKMLQDSHSAKTFGLEEMRDKEDNPLESISCERAQNPSDSVESHDFKVRLAKLVARLPEKERMVIALYYGEELKLKEVGEILGVSESRVCQIHAQATHRLQTSVQGFN